MNNNLHQQLVEEEQRGIDLVLILQAAQVLLENWTNKLNGLLNDRPEEFP